jgi:hypothetical protein
VDATTLVFLGAVVVYFLAWVSGPMLARRRWGMRGALLVLAGEIALALLISHYFHPFKVPPPPPPPEPRMTPTYSGPQGLGDAFDFILFRVIPVVGAALGAVIAAIWSLVAWFRRPGADRIAKGAATARAKTSE